MRTPKRHQKRTTDGDGCRSGRRPSPEAQARYADAMAQATLRRLHTRF